MNNKKQTEYKLKSSMMIEKTIQWFKNNWFLWVLLILGYIAIRAFGYDIEIVNKSINWEKYK